MRKFKNLHKFKQLELNNLFRELESLFECRESNEYEHLAISIFDHWLNRGEAIKEIGKVKIKKQKEHDSKIHKFCNLVTEQNEHYLIKLRGRNKDIITFREFTSNIARNEFLAPMPYNIGDQWRFVLALPEIEAIYFEGSDFTHHLYYKDFNKLTELLTLVKESGLHVLQKL